VPFSNYFAYENANELFERTRHNRTSRAMSFRAKWNMGIFESSGIISVTHWGSQSLPLLSYPLPFYISPSVSLLPSPPLFLLPFLPLSSRTPEIQLGSLGEHCKLLQGGLGLSDDGLN